MRILSLGTAGLLTLLLAGCPPREEAVDGDKQPYQLVYRFEDGETRSFQLAIDGEAESATRPAEDTAPGEPLETGFNAEILIRQEVRGEPEQEPEPAQQQQQQPEQESPEPRTFQLSQRVTRFNLQVERQDTPEPRQYDATYQDGEVTTRLDGQQIPLPERQRQQLLAALERPLRATVDQHGRIDEIHWTEPNGVAPPNEEANERAFWQVLAGGAFDLWFGLIRLPEEETRVGDTWSFQDRTPVRIPEQEQTWTMLRNARYLLREVEEEDGRRIALIDITEDIRLFQEDMPLPDEEPAPQQQEPDPKAMPDVVQHRTGTARFDIQAGRLLDTEQQFQISWQTRLRVPASLEDWQEMRTVDTTGQATGSIRLAPEKEPEEAPAPGTQPGAGGT